MAIASPRAATLLSPPTTGHETMSVGFLNTHHLM
jgi:hypothetical protein